jgi:hypothetical protein
MIGTVLPNGQRFSADHCTDFMTEPAVREQLKWQYNLAVAASAAMIEVAAQAYEQRHPDEISAPLALAPKFFDWLRSLVTTQ